MELGKEDRRGEAWSFVPGPAKATQALFGFAGHSLPLKALQELVGPSLTK
jgi:hypothetical protein